MSNETIEQQVSKERELAHRREIERVMKEMIHVDLLQNRITLAENKDCPLCLKQERTTIRKMRIKHGPYGAFLSCNQYPDCKFTWNCPNLEVPNTYIV